MSRVALVGLATTHPDTDCAQLQELGCHVLVATDAPDVQAAHASNLLAGGCSATTMDEVALGTADLAVVTVRPRHVAGVVRRLLAHGVPTFVNKPAVATVHQLAALDRAVASWSTPFLTCSVLRYAPKVVEFARDLDSSRVLSARVTIRHDIAGYAAPERSWQDEPREGGGHLVGLGIHGVEALSALLGPPVGHLCVRAATRVHKWSRSEDSAVMVGTFGRVPASIAFVGASFERGYHIVLSMADGDQEVTVRGDGIAANPVSIGYRHTMLAALTMPRTGHPPVPWEETRTLLRSVLDAGVVAQARDPDVRHMRDGCDLNGGGRG